MSLSLISRLTSCSLMSTSFSPPSLLLVYFTLHQNPSNPRRRHSRLLQKTRLWAGWTLWVDEHELVHHGMVGASSISFPLWLELSETLFSQSCVSLGAFLMMTQLQPIKRLSHSLGPSHSFLLSLPTFYLALFTMHNDHHLEYVNRHVENALPFWLSIRRSYSISD